MAVKETSEDQPAKNLRPARPRLLSRVRPLAPSVYLLRNAGRTIPLVTVIGLAVLLICSVITLIDSIPFSIRTIYSYSKDMLGISPRGDPTETPKLLKEIQQKSPVPLDRLMICRASSSQVQSIVGAWPFVMLGLGQDDMRYYLRHLGVTHIDGRLPRPGEPEAIVSRTVAKNLKLEIFNPGGSWKTRSKSVILSPDKASSYSPRYVKVVGIADTDKWIMLDTVEYQRLYHFPPIDLGLVFAKNLTDQSKLDHWAEKHFEGRHAEIFAYHQIEKQTVTMFHTLYTILNVVIVVLALVITLMMGMLMNIYQSQRLIEFGLLQAIGYTKKQLLARVFTESVIFIAGGWGFGIAASYALLRVADRVLMAPHAFAMPPFDMTAFRYTLPLPIAILTVAAFTVWWRFRDFDPVGVVERRLV